MWIKYSLSFFLTCYCSYSYHFLLSAMSSSVFLHLPVLRIQNRQSTPFLCPFQVLWKKSRSTQNELSMSFNISNIKAYNYKCEHPLLSPIKASEGSFGNEDSVEEEQPLGDSLLIGEDAAVFNLSSQKLSSWIYFTIVLGVVLAILNFIWIDPKTGYGNAFVQAISSVSDNHEIVMLIILLVFAIVHSGLASLRDIGERLVGERAFRVIFAGLSLPLAVSAVVYFIDHRYDGVQLWQLQGVVGMHEFVWLMSFVSFFFLYPSTFNLLEVAAVDKPKMHMYETGIMRITRHPQMVGQFLWCIAHTLWIGNSFMLTTSFGLLAHHLFGVWNGDRRLAIRYGEAFEIVKNRTSIIPFAAILDGRQKLPKDYYREFLRLPYITIFLLTVGAYFAHPLLQAGSYHLNW